jgi:hypothetical protein
VTIHIAEKNGSLIMNRKNTRSDASLDDQLIRDREVGSVFSSLRSKQWTKADMKEFIAKIEETLWSKGIKIEPTKVDLQLYSPLEE